MTEQYLTFEDLQAHIDHLDEIGVTYDAVITGGGNNFRFHLRDESGEPDRQIEVIIFSGGTWSVIGLPAFDKPTHVQLMPTIDGGNHVRMAEDREEPNQWSVYLGRPGAFEWQADFREFIVAECFALKLAADHGADLIRGRA